MIYSEVFRVFFTITVFGIDLVKGETACYLGAPKNIGLRRFPIAFTIERSGRSSLIYPDRKGYLTVSSDKRIVFSCAATNFDLAELRHLHEIEVTCHSGEWFKYNEKFYQYAQLICAKNVQIETKKSGRMCQPGNYTIFDVGYRTKKYFFTLFCICFDEKNLNTLYTWYELRSPFTDINQEQKRIGFFKDDVYGKLDVESIYSRSTQRTTINNILQLETNSLKYIDDRDFYISKAHFISRTDFFFAREQAATFNYLNVSPQWYKSNNTWNEVEKLIRKELAKYPYSRRVIVSGVHGLFTLPNNQNQQRELYLIMPGEKLAVPQFQWKLVHYVDAPSNSVVYISYNNRTAEVPAVLRDTLVCALKTCPGMVNNRVTDPWIQSGFLYCCDIVSFQNAYGWFDRDVLSISSGVSPTPDA